MADGHRPCFVRCQQCREYRTILANEDHTTALKSERRLAAREWSDKLLHLQNSLDRARALQQDALAQLADERKVSEPARSINGPVQC